MDGWMGGWMDGRNSQDLRDLHNVQDLQNVQNVQNVHDVQSMQNLLFTGPLTCFTSGRFRLFLLITDKIRVC